MYYNTESLSVTVLDMTWLNSKEIYLTISHHTSHEKIILLPRDKLDHLEQTHLSPHPSLIQHVLWPSNLKRLDLSNSLLSDEKTLGSLFFARCPLLEDLNLNKTDITTSGIKVLTKQLNWPSLKKLFLSSNKVTFQGIESLVSALESSNLQVLDLSHNNNISDQGLQILASGKWPELESLNLRNISTTAKGTKSLVDTPKWPDLKILDISDNPLQNEGLALLFSGKWPLLENLSLRNIAATPEGIKSLAGILEWSNLKVLDISDNNISNQGLHILASGKWLLLENLNLRNTFITAEGMESLVSPSKCPNLKVLNLSDNSLQNEGLEVFSFAKWPLLENLNLKNTKIKETGIRGITKPKWPNLKTLDVSENFIYDTGLVILSSGNWPQLENLSLQKISIGETAIGSMMDIAKWPNLKALNISDNFISEGLKVLFSEKWPLLESLSLKNTWRANKIEGAMALSKGLNLQVLDVSYNFIDDRGFLLLSSVKLPLLENLNLKNALIKQTGIEIMVNTSKWPNLKALDVSNNRISDAGLKTLFFGGWPLLEALNLRNIGLTVDGIESMVSISKWSNLKILDISDNFVYDTGLKMLSSGNWPLIEGLKLIKANITVEGISQLIKVSKWSNLREVHLTASHSPPENAAMQALISTRWPRAKVIRDE